MQKVKGSTRAVGRDTAAAWRFRPALRSRQVLFGERERSKFVRSG
jgi:hypothetical protein